MNAGEEGAFDQLVRANHPLLIKGPYLPCLDQVLAGKSVLYPLWKVPFVGCVEREDPIAHFQPFKTRGRSIGEKNKCKRECRVQAIGKKAGELRYIHECRQMARVDKNSTTQKIAKHKKTTRTRSTNYTLETFVEAAKTKEVAQHHPT